MSDQPTTTDLQQKYRSFLDVLPLTLALAGLPPSEGRLFSEEQIEVEKKPVVTERVTVGKRTTEEEERVEATLAKENVKVEKRSRDTPPNQR